MARARRKPTAPRKPRARRKHGGARKGAGGPRAKLEKALLDAIGVPPVDDPVAASVWLHRALLQLWWAEANGTAPPALAERLRATAGSVIRSLPDSARAELDRRLRRGGKRTGPAPQPLAKVDGPPTYRS